VLGDKLQLNRPYDADPADHRGQPAGEVVDGRRVLAGQAPPGLLDHVLGSARSESSSRRLQTPSMISSRTSNVSIRRSSYGREPFDPEGEIGVPVARA
jgi:hypothetical protein